MKKFTSIMLLLLCTVATAWADNFSFENGKYYHFYNAHSSYAGTYLFAPYSDGTNVLWAVVDDNDISFYWQAEIDDDGNVYLKNAKYGNYMLGSSTSNSAWTMTSDKTNAAVTATALSTTANETYGLPYGIYINSEMMHPSGHSASSEATGSIISFTNKDATRASAWFIVEKELPSTVCAITYNFVYENDTKYTQTVSVQSGEAYPDYSVFLPKGVTAASKPEGTVSADEVVEVALTLSVDLPFEAAESADKITTWYYIQNCGGNGYAISNAYISAGEQLTCTSSVDSDNVGDYVWGFVGDIWGGYKLINYGVYTESATGNCAAGLDLDAETSSMTTIDSATQFIYAESSYKEEEDSYFCLYANDKYLNQQVVNNSYYLRHRNATGQNSTFFVTKYEASSEGGSTGVTAIEATTAEQTIYSITGRRVNSITTPGIYIVNGVKVVVR